jgi:1-deoxy-D-xylulose-5-phosphate reductoisomerase
MAVSTNRLDLAEIGNLSFEEPDLERFPALRLARQALIAGPGRVAALSAANEIAVEAFLAGRIRFLDISRIVEEAGEVLEASEAGLIAKTPSSLAEVRAVDLAARRAAQRIAGSLAAA